MNNIPSNDPGLVLLPNATAFCEWLVKLGDPPKVATCVEVSEMICNHIVANRPVSAAEDISLAQDLIKRGQASASGATNYLAASQQMTRLGIANVAYGKDWFATHDFVPVVKDAIAYGSPVLFGVYAAFKLYDDWTKAPQDAGVDGHGIALVGMDATGAIVADPNTVQAKSGDFVHYSWATLRNAGGTYPSMVIPNAMSFPTGVPCGWSDDGTTLKAPNGQTCTHGVRTEVLNAGWNPDNVPLGAEYYTDPADPTDPKAGFGGRQYFRDELICWIKATNQTRRVPGGSAALALASQQPVSTSAKLDALVTIVSSVSSQLHTLETTLSQGATTARS